MARKLRDEDLEAVLEELRGDKLYWRAKLLAKDVASKPLEPETVPAALGRALRQSGLFSEIKSCAFRSLLQVRLEQRQMQRLAHPDLPLPPLPVRLSKASNLDAAEGIRRGWSELILQRLRDLSQEQKQPYLRPRAVPAPGARGSRQEEPDDEVYTRPIVDLEDLFDALTVKTRGSSAKTRGGFYGQASPLGWSALGLQLGAPTAAELRVRFAELSPERAEHLGLSEPNRATAASLAEQRLQEGQRLLQHRDIAQLLAYARLGVPASLRFEVWTACLSPTPAPELQDIAQGVTFWEWLTDDVLRLDVSEFCANDVCYFPFDELVEAMILTLSRDPFLSEGCACGPPHDPIVAKDSGAWARSEEPGAETGRKCPTLVPPSGVVPFYGFACYACPFAFLSDKLEVVYPLFRAMYCHHLCRLHTIGSREGSLLHLSALFESLLFSAAPRVAFHLVSLGTKAAPLRHALPWLVRGFVGFLRVEQVLLLWDRVIGFDAPELFAVLAAAIFTFRAPMLLSARSGDDVATLCEDVTSLQTVPLLQGFLFADSPGGQE